ncbi:hypothetical protein [Streptomyces sp. 2A115]|uniref:hypothetical protein n=1 Tax=Streptomyces sp. 2A115 TaxID=3457439 RepID=UPI003FD64B25
MPLGEVAAAAPATVAGVISNQRTEYGIPHTVSCRALGVSQSWFYKWRTRQPARRELRGPRLKDEVREVFDRSGGTYSSLRVFIELVRQG